MRSFTFSVFYRRRKTDWTPKSRPDACLSRRHIIMRRIKVQHLTFYTANSNENGTRNRRQDNFIKTEFSEIAWPDQVSKPR